MKDVKEAMFEGMYKRVVKIKEILEVAECDDELAMKIKEKDTIDLHNIVDYVVINSCRDIYSYEHGWEGYRVLKISPEGEKGVVYLGHKRDDMAELRPKEVEFKIEDYSFLLPTTKFCMEVLRMIYDEAETFSEETWEDIRWRGISRSCRNMLQKFEDEGVIEKVLDEYIEEYIYF